MLVRNKIDLQPEITELVVHFDGWEGGGCKKGDRVWVISCRSESEQLARELGVPMFHTSVKTDKNVASVFRSLATAYQSRNRDQVEVEQVGSWI